MKLFIFVLLFVISGCSDATEKNKTVINSELCDFSFNSTGPCIYGTVKVTLDAKKIASDEKSLNRLHVEKQGKTFFLDILKGTSIIDGDKGYISFEDINFDSIPDISITTSFGLANLYMDYWVYDSVKNVYAYVGNYAAFKIDKKNKILSNTVKSSAAKYISSTYTWQGLSLVKK